MPELASYAVASTNSRGRLHPDSEPIYRGEFQRDRDRIVHSTAFRRLEYKTQVFVNHEGDLFRTRLTHSLEVAQIARAIARALRVNEDLAEAVSLAHDLGHTPFGHAGQEALNECMREYGGFEHNLQSLRTVDLLEERYATFPGLNLCFETREGIIKHCSPENARQLGDLGERFLNRRQPSLEAQICNLADEVAYNSHDIDDGLRAGLISLEQLEEVALFARHVGQVRERYPGLIGRRLIHETSRRVINTLVCDLIETTSANIACHAPRELADVRLAPPLVAFSDQLSAQQQAMKRFLRTHLYHHYHVLRTANKAARIVTDLFSAFLSDQRLLPPQYQTVADDAPRRVADYIAGMTDRYAIKEHRRLFAVDAVER
ncbi:MAG TPA: deoxyguanosinetriphosphate triphosphohydrolase [Accumulibacter sp.]|uniref:deoxyguanosinetriphosphate triphosphohydrolase n=1 Tax=Accumulibacter sp. TaxID=2053492 RepID=UPI002D09F146|nr:deoxyguanosinetriphosphate triphosphohydrolase [Accumulibacter sp.]HMV04049.1 deoxyguanosinetriphosphate triphosphohydrolase [Accumulibacter sp.]HMW62625.1 deoxyguanosinetriphosphate triphosphohydrolase [Accumulibacter sp.]HMW80053.1 deoxyguanosinetriphosphate triphosphohydrolase [Accumulibacter sp.]HMX68912.1 deoxyguanosinetriphosphate triphosphohydrolase [Accumulibacter sp.]HNB66382.1 deoxyguanosinetriphosphate triphosphohydrolase [Accumulibacter sp.]